MKVYVEPVETTRGRYRDTRYEAIITVEGEITPRSRDASAIALEAAHDQVHPFYFGHQSQMGRLDLFKRIGDEKWHVIVTKPYND